MIEKQRIKLAFYTNFDNHHQIPLADELYRIYGNSYIFITRENIPKGFLRKGYHHYDRPYILRMETSEKNTCLAKKILMEAEFVLFGDAPLEWIQPRIKANKPVLYNERWFKTNWRGRLRWSFWKNLLITHVPSRWRPSYMLAASAYMRSDCHKIFSYPRKVYRWGYFPAIDELDIDEVMNSKSGSTLKMAWCGTMNSLKHPELPIQLMARLRQDGIEAHLTMIGNGELLEKNKQLAEDCHVRDHISFIQDIPNDEVKKIFQNSHIFLFTSNWQEGWGCVLNEAMASGCAVVASHEIGSVPFLLKHKENGIIFKSKSLDSLYDNLKELIQHPEEIDRLARNAYQTMKDTWSPLAAARALSQFIHHLEDTSVAIPVNGPCSEAPSISPSSFIKSLS